jgi:cytidylate kinase
VERSCIITIDGPAASGKSSVARAVADALNIPFVSSGLLYRAVTFLVLAAQLDINNEASILDLLARHEVVLEAVPIEPNRIWIDGEDVSAAMHTDDVDANVSVVARYPQVRHWVDERLREVKGDFVVEGRDMGAKVFPQAAHKFYLTAPAEIRAQRRVGERKANLSEVTEALKRRDQLDAGQMAAATDVEYIETGALTLEEVVDTILHSLRSTQTL